MVSVKGSIKSCVAMLVLSYVGQSLYLFLVSQGVGVHHNNHHPGKCRIVPGISCGSEKISVTRDGLAFITSGQRVITNCNRDYLKGRLYTFDFNQPGKGASQLVIKGENFNVDSFAPHGMDIYEKPGEDLVLVYVVNHADGVESVEVFVYDRKKPSEIVHKDTITDDKFTCLNDVAIIDADHFYVTNLAKYCSNMMVMMFDLTFLKSFKHGSVVFYDRGRTTFVVHGTHMNGLTLSRDKNHVLVVHGDKGVRVYARDSSDGNLLYVRDIFVGYSCDNIILDKDTGHFYVAYFKNYKFADVAENKTAYCGSSGGMLSIGGMTMDDVEVTEILHDNGKDFICGASSFVHYKGQYLVGTIFDKLGYCRKP